MPRTIDINCDLGEGYPYDAELMKYISSANIACGIHAGDQNTMRRTVELAIENNVAIGAHPSYFDRENFGRTDQNISPDEIRNLVLCQVLGLYGICDDAGGQLHHVKPHGALYNRSARDPEVAHAIADVVSKISGKPVLFGLSGSCSIKEAEAIGVRTASEVFADRTYQLDGTLTPRSQSEALIENDDDAISQALRFVNSETVTTITGEVITVKCDTICIHGDGEHAVSFASKIHAALTEQGLEIRAIDPHNYGQSR